MGHLVTLWTLLFAVFRASQRRGGLTTGDQNFFWSTYVSVLGLKHYNIHYKRKKQSSKTPLPEQVHYFTIVNVATVQLTYFSLSRSLPYASIISTVQHCEARRNCRVLYLFIYLVQH